VKEESVHFDKRDGRYLISMKGDNPFSIAKKDLQMKLTYCYYTPGEELNPESFLKLKGSQY